MHANSAGLNRRTRVDYTWAAEVFLGGFTNHLREELKQSTSASQRFHCEWFLSQYRLKYCDSRTTPARERAKRAFDKFVSTERVCGGRNDTGISQNLDGSFIDPLVSRVIHISRQKILSILGPTPTLSEVKKEARFGPGASTRLNRAKSALYYKLQGNLEVTQNCLSLLNECVDERLLVSPVHVVKGNKLTTVPKSTEIDRMIAIEPDLNMFIQKGIGTVIRNKLRQSGLDLNTQQRNQDKALKGSISGKLATVDLSSASDSISIFTVRDLLPPDWFDLLMAARSESGTYRGSNIVYNKISSMGNGYTFELESLIFWVISLAVSQVTSCNSGDICTYGDDIIIETGAVGLLTKVLSYYGFSYNDEKSFVDGPFRESCGKHYHSGRDVTPVYYREPARRLLDLYLLHNNCLRWYVKYSGGYIPTAVYDYFLFLRNVVNSKRSIPAIPLWGFGDGAFAGTFDEVKPQKSNEIWQEYFICQTSRLVSLGKKRRNEACFQAILYEQEFYSPEHQEARYSKVLPKAERDPQYIRDGRIGRSHFEMVVQRWPVDYTLV